MSGQGGGGSVMLGRLFRLQQDIQAERREQRVELRDTRSLLLAQAEQGRRLERCLGGVDRRLSELRDDLELMFKSEMMGRLGNFEVATERRLGDLEERIGTLEAGQRSTRTPPATSAASIRPGPTRPARDASTVIGQALAPASSQPLPDDCASTTQ